jgi:hypothetical protein
VTGTFLKIWARIDFKAKARLDKQVSWWLPGFTKIRSDIIPTEHGCSREACPDSMFMDQGTESWRKERKQNIRIGRS